MKISVVLLALKAKGQKILNAPRIHFLVTGRKMLVSFWFCILSCNKNTVSYIFNVFPCAFAKAGKGVGDKLLFLNTFIENIS